MCPPHPPQNRFIGGAVLLSGLKTLAMLTFSRSLSTFILIIRVRVRCEVVTTSFDGVCVVAVV